MSSENILIPLYAFYDGDSIGILVLAYSNDTIRELIQKIEKAISVRMAQKENVGLSFKGKFLEDQITLRQTEISSLDRVDVLVR